MTNTVLGDTYGVLYRAATGKVDKYTKANLQLQEQAQLQKAGMDATTAAATAKADTEKTLKINGACPCNCATNIPVWVWYVVGGILVLIVFSIFAKEAARSVFGS